jgi:predicted 2-oxoglutarate/Fe(II)-dependent dioxygenase YbiX
MNRDVATYLKIYHNIFDADFCAETIEQLSLAAWQKHSYNNPLTNTNHSYDNDLSISDADIEHSKKINEKVWFVIKQYLNDINLPWFGGWSGYSLARFNRYDVGTEMRNHCDHIHSLFEGPNRGVPILSVLGGLNDNYKGGELVFWDDEPIELPAGAIAVFPSNFLFPHKVLPVTEGSRYSYVSWAW